MKKCLLFLQTGCMFSIIESVCRGVPLLLIPFFSEQFRNAKRAEQSGFARHLDFNVFTTETLVNTIQDMTTNKSYFNEAKYVSTLVTDHAVHPMDEAVWWIEHVEKSRGAKYLKSHAVDMNCFSYLLLDVFMAIILGSLLCVVLIFSIVKIFVCMFKERKRQKRLKLY